MPSKAQSTYSDSEKSSRPTNSVTNDVEPATMPMPAQTSSSSAVNSEPCSRKRAQPTDSRITSAAMIATVMRTSSVRSSMRKAPAIVTTGALPHAATENPTETASVPRPTMMLSPRSYARAKVASSSRPKAPTISATSGAMANQSTEGP